MNSGLIIVPLFGIKQRISFPTLINPPFSSTKILNLTFLKFKAIYDFSNTVNMRVESFCGRHEIEILQKILQRWRLDLYCDYTPMGYYNLDLVILNWFYSRGKY